MSADNLVAVLGPVESAHLSSCILVVEACVGEHVPNPFLMVPSLRPPPDPSVMWGPGRGFDSHIVFAYHPLWFLRHVGSCMEPPSEVGKNAKPHRKEGRSHRRSVQDLVKELDTLMAEFKKRGLWVPDFDGDRAGVNQEKSRSTGNTKVYKKRLKRDHEVYLVARIEQLRKRLEDDDNEIEKKRPKFGEKRGRRN